MSESNDEKTQKTQPFTDEDSVEIPVPSKDQIMSDFEKIAVAPAENDSEDPEY